MYQEFIAHTDAPPQHKALRSPLRIALGYAVFAVLWILVSDRALFTFVSDPAYQALFSQLKGVGFVAVTGLFLYLLLRAGDVAGSSAVSDAAIGLPVLAQLYFLAALLALALTLAPMAAAAALRISVS